MSKKCTGWCAPTIIYAILASVGTVVSIIHPDLQDATERVAVFIAHILSGALWTAILYVMCMYCYNTAAWVLLLIPFVLAFIMLFFLAAIVISGLRRNRNRERMQDYTTAYARNAAPIENSNPPGTVLDLSQVKPDPSSPTHVKGVCGFAARPAKFDILTQKQMQSPGSLLIAPGQQNFAQFDQQVPTGCHEGFPPNPIVKYAMPSDISRQ